MIRVAHSPAGPLSAGRRKLRESPVVRLADAYWRHEQRVTAGGVGAADSLRELLEDVIEATGCSAKQAEAAAWALLNTFPPEAGHAAE